MTLDVPLSVTITQTQNTDRPPSLPETGRYPYLLVEPPAFLFVCSTLVKLNLTAPLINVGPVCGTVPGGPGIR